MLRTFNSLSPFTGLSVCADKPTAELYETTSIVGVDIASEHRIAIYRHFWVCIELCIIPGREAQSVMCLATDVCLTAIPGVASSIPARSHTFVEIDHEMISTVILPLPLIHSRRVVVSYKRKYVHELLVIRLFKPAQEKVWLGELTAGFSLQKHFQGSL